MTVTRDSKTEEFLGEWRVRLNENVRRAANGNGKDAGDTKTYFSMSAHNDLMMEARNAFLNEVRAAGFKVQLHDSNDDNDYFVYVIEW